jgi:hypothetical protein
MSTLEESPMAQGLGNGPKIVWCKDDSLLSCYGWWEVKMDELQSGPLMVKALTGRRFVEWDNPWLFEE